MPDLKISELGSATSLAGSELLAVVQGGTTKKATVADIGSGLNRVGSTLYVDAVNNRVGIGTASPGQALDVSGADGVRARVVATAGGTPGLILSSAGNTAYTIKAGNADNSLRIDQDGTDRITLASGGNLGIGTSSPLGRLGIVGSATATVIISRSSNGTTASPVETQLIGSTFTNGAYEAGVYALNSFTDNSANWLAFKTTAIGSSSTTKMTLDGPGNFGIGTAPSTVYTGASTTTPLAQFAKTDNTTTLNLTTSSLALINTSTTAGASSALNFVSVNSGSTRVSHAAIYGGTGAVNAGWNDGFLAFATGTSGAAPTERARIDSAGNLGLGVTPSAWAIPSIQFQGQFAIGPFGYTRNGYYDTGWKYVAAGQATAYQQASGVHSWYTAPSGTAGNAITFTQAMTLDASGNLGVGTASPSSRLHVYGAAATTLRVDNGDNAAAQTIALATGGTNRATFSIATSSSDLVIKSEDAGGRSNGIQFWTGNASAERARIDASGNFGIGRTPGVVLDVTAVTGCIRLISSTGTNHSFATYENTGGSLRVGLDSSTGGVLASGTSAYSGVVSVVGAYPLSFATNNTERVRVKAEGQMRFVPLAAAPTTNVENGDVYYDSTTNKLRVRAGGAWVDLH